MLNTKFSPWPSFSKAEADVVQQVLLSNKVNYWTGTQGREFEKEFAAFTDTKYAVAVANGTLALDLALVGLGICEGDEVIVPSRTFLASVSCVVTAGATPIFADVDISSQNITAATIDAVRTEKTKAIICVHLAGQPCEMDEIMSLANSHDIFVIEDCAQAHGAKYKGRSVGSFGHVGAWSFCQDKIMTTGGEGGMVTTNDEQLWKKMWAYKDHGKSWDAVYNKEHPAGFRWLHESFGTNWRLTEMQSAIGRIQLTRMQGWFEKRNKNASELGVVLSLYKCIRLINVADYIDHAQYKYYVFIRPEYLMQGWNRDRIVNEINALGIPCFQGSCSEVYLEKAFEATTYKPKIILKNAIELGKTSMMFLVHPTLSQVDVIKTVNTINKVLTLASKN